MPDTRQKKESRTFLPEILAPGTGLSPVTDKSVIPTNNVHSILDVLNGRPYKLPGGGGDWSEGEDTWTSYRETGDDYKRKARDLAILDGMSQIEIQDSDIWKVKVPGGTRTFPTFSAAQRFKRKFEENGQKVIWITRVQGVAADSNQTIKTSAFDALNQTMSATFAVESLDLKNMVRETGTCFCVRNGFFVTCAHVIKKIDANSDEPTDFTPESKQIKIFLRKDGRRYLGNLVAIDSNIDIAIIAADISCPVLDLQQEINVGDEVLTVGSPYGYEGEASFGHVGSLDREFFETNQFAKYMFLDIAVYSGNSGGAIVNKSNGKVVGMVVALVGNENDQGLSAGLPAEYIEQFCSQHSIL